jgi:hypothetical protein
LSRPQSRTLWRSWRIFSSRKYISLNRWDNTLWDREVCRAARDMISELTASRSRIRADMQVIASRLAHRFAQIGLRLVAACTRRSTALMSRGRRLNVCIMIVCVCVCACQVIAIDFSLLFLLGALGWWGACKLRVSSCVSYLCGTPLRCEAVPCAFKARRR